MDKFSLEDIQTLRRCSGISYEEAVALLEYHNGSLAQALTDLEKQGKIQDHRSDPSSQKAAGGFADAIKKICKVRLVIQRNQNVIINLPVLYVILCWICAPYLMLFSFLACLATGYRFQILKPLETPESDGLGDTLRHATDNARNAVEEFAHAFSQTNKSAQRDGQAETRQPEKPVDSITESRASTAFRAGISVDVPELHVPFRVRSQDGNMKVSQEPDGYNSATVE